MIKFKIGFGTRFWNIELLITPFSWNFIPFVLSDWNPDFDSLVEGETHFLFLCFNFGLIKRMDLSKILIDKYEKNRL